MIHKTQYFDINERDNNEKTTPSKQNKLISLCAFYFVILLCFQVPETFNQYFHHVIPRITIFFVPPIATILLLNLIDQTHINFLRSNLDQSDYFFLLFILALTIIELNHYVSNAYNPNFEMILQYLWLYVLYYTIRSFKTLFDIQRFLVLAAIQIIFLLSMIQIAVYLGVLKFGIPNFHLFRQRPDIFNVNTSSYSVVFTVFLWLFCMPIEVPPRQRIIYGILLIPGMILLLLNQTRGALLLLLILLFIKILSKINFTAKIALISIFSLIFLAGNTIGNKKIFYDITRYLSFGRGLTYEQEKVARGLPPDSEKFTTVKFRILMFPKAVDVLAESPIIGVGYTKMMSTRIANMPSHTHYLSLIIAYGVVGAILFMLLIISLWGPSTTKSNNGSHNKLAFIIVVFGSMTFINDLFMWYGLIAYLSRFPDNSDKIKKKRFLPIEQ